MIIEYKKVKVEGTYEECVMFLKLLTEIKI